MIITIEIRETGHCNCRNANAIANQPEVNKKKGRIDVMVVNRLCAYRCFKYIIKTFDDRIINAMYVRCEADHGDLPASKIKSPFKCMVTFLSAVNKVI